MGVQMQAAQMLFLHGFCNQLRLLGTTVAAFLSNDGELEVTKWLQCRVPPKEKTWLSPIWKEADEDTFVAEDLWLVVT